MTLCAWLLLGSVPVRPRTPTVVAVFRRADPETSPPGWARRAAAPGPLLRRPRSSSAAAAPLQRGWSSTSTACPKMGNVPARPLTPTVAAIYSPGRAVGQPIYCAGAAATSPSPLFCRCCSAPLRVDVTKHCLPHDGECLRSSEYPDCRRCPFAGLIRSRCPWLGPPGHCAGAAAPQPSLLICRGWSESAPLRLDIDEHCLPHDGESVSGRQCTPTVVAVHLPGQAGAVAPGLGPPGHCAGAAAPSPSTFLCRHRSNPLRVVVDVHCRPNSPSSPATSAAWIRAPHPVRPAGPCGRPSSALEQAPHRLGPSAGRTVRRRFPPGPGEDRDPLPHLSWPDASAPAELAIFACDFGRLEPRPGLLPPSSCPGASARRSRHLCGGLAEARDRHYLLEAMLAQRCGPRRLALRSRARPPSLPETRHRPCGSTLRCDASRPCGSTLAGVGQCPLAIGHGCLVLLLAGELDRRPVSPLSSTPACSGAGSGWHCRMQIADSTVYLGGPATGGAEPSLVRG
jgi:hypothetical protein